jgi:hypothetical protein
MAVEYCLIRSILLIIWFVVQCILVDSIFLLVETAQLLDNFIEFSYTNNCQTTSVVVILYFSLILCMEYSIQFQSHNIYIILR